MLKKISVVFAALLLTVQMLLSLPLTTHAAEDFSVAAKAGFAVDADSGKILYDQNGEQRLGLASVTKLISSYVILDAIKEKKINWDTEVPISDYAEKLSTTEELSNVPLHKGDKYTVRELFDATIIQSANAAVVALAEKIAGSEPKFVDLMRQKAKDLGIKDAIIINASGLNNTFLGDHRYPGTGENDENELSARDIALLTQHLLKEYPEIIDVSKTTELEFGANTTEPVKMENWNQLLPGEKLAKEGVDGLKTGTTDFAGACFVGTMVKDGHRVITVILNATNQKEDDGARFVETAKLMDYCYANWQLKEESLNNATTSVMKTAEVKDGVKSSVPLHLNGSVKYWVRNDMAANPLKITPTLKKSLLTDHKLNAPVTKDQTVGKATVEVQGDPYGYLEPQDITQVDVLASQSVKQANILVRTWNNLVGLFN